MSYPAPGSGAQNFVNTATLAETGRPQRSPVTSEQLWIAFALLLGGGALLLIARTRRC